jgi:probable HAF family extracellular repeat protein
LNRASLGSEIPFIPEERRKFRRVQLRNVRKSRSATVSILDNDTGIPVPVSYTVQALGIPSSQSSWESFAYSLNNNTVPSIAGSFRYSPSTSYDHHAFRAYNGAHTDLMPYNRSYAYGINNANVAVGRSDYGNYGTSAPINVPTMWNASGTFTILGRLPSSYNTGNDSAVDINSSGVIVGSSINVVGKMHAVKWDPNSTTAINLESLDQDQNSISFAYAINDNGRIVGKSQIAGVGSAYHAFMTSPNPTFLQSDDDLGTMDGGNGQSEATDLNNWDEIVGASDTGSGYRAFFKAVNTDPNDGFTDLGVLPGGNKSIALGINNKGHIVGWSRTTSTGSNRAFIFYNSGSSMLNLNSQTLINGTGWVFLSAEEINDAGYIVGWGTKGGSITAFILSPNF